MQFPPGAPRARAVAAPLVLALTLLISAASASAQGADPLIGTWVLNLAKSTYIGLTPPKSEIRTYDYHGDGMILCTYTTIREQGERGFGHWIGTLDGKEMPGFSRARGQTPAEYFTFKRIDAQTVEASARQNGRIIYAGSWTISPDGKTLTYSLKGTNAQGQPTTRIRVYDKTQ